MLHEKDKTTPAAVSSAQLKEMREVDMHTVEREKLADIKEVKVDTRLPDRERMLDFMRQIKNPYCYISNGMLFKISFTGKEGLEECLKASIFTEQ